MKKNTLLTTQKFCRFALKLPIVDKIMWRLFRRVRIHVSKTDTHGMFETTFDDTTKIWVSLRDHIESQIFFQGVQEADRGEVKLLKSMLESEYIFFDIGANIGVFTLIAAKRVKDGKVHAFEPSKIHLTKLRENLRINGFQNIIINPVGLANSASNRKLYFPKSKQSITNTGLASFYVLEDKRAEYEEERIITMRLDDYVEENAIQRLDIMKIDVEGAEMEVLEGGINTLNAFRARVMMEVSKINLSCAGRTLKEVIDFWFSLDYNIFRIEHNGKLVPIYNLSGFKDHQNIYCCPKEITCS